MPGKVIGKQMNLGFAGNCSRISDNVIVNRPAASKICFGRPVKLTADNKFAPCESVDDDFYGVAVRIVKQSGSYSDQIPFYEEGAATDVLTRGGVTVICDAAPTEAGGAVFLAEMTDDEGDAYIGFSSAATQTDAGPPPVMSAAIPNAVFSTGQTDANGVSEITILTRAI